MYGFLPYINDKITWYDYAACEGDMIHRNLGSLLQSSHLGERRQVSQCVPGLVVCALTGFHAQVCVKLLIEKGYLTS